MRRQIEHCRNPICNKPYMVERCSRAFGRKGQVGNIHCPHCGFNASADPSKAFRTSALPHYLEEWITPLK
jgi:hypothetical protein